MSVKTPQQRAVALVKAGKTFQEAGDAVGLSRGAVAGACDRAGVKSKMTRSKVERWRARISEKATERWARGGKKAFGH